MKLQDSYQGSTWGQQKTECSKGIQSALHMMLQTSTCCIRVILCKKCCANTCQIINCYITMNILYFNILYNNCIVSILMNYIHNGMVSLGITWLDLSLWNVWMIETSCLNFTQNCHSCNEKFCIWFHVYAVT